MSDRDLQPFVGVDLGTVSDALVRLRVGSWTNGIRPANPNHAGFVGRARTVLIGERRDGVKAPSKYRILSTLDAGDVLVIGGEPYDDNFLGDNVGRYGELRGLAAIVSDSLARDVEGLASLTMPVFIRGSSARMPLATVPVAFDTPVICGGTVVRPRDVIVGGRDGLAVIPDEAVGAVAAELDDLSGIEIRLRAAIERGAGLEEIEALAASKVASRPLQGSGQAATS